MGIKTFGKALAAATLAVFALGGATPAFAEGPAYANQFDQILGTESRTPASVTAIFDTSLEARIASLADGSRGRIGVYAVDLVTGQEVGVLADQRFPMASTSKVAVAATFLAGVDAGRLSLSNSYRLPRPGGASVPASQLLTLMIAKSCNDCTDALLNAVGGPSAVNAWVRKAGIKEFDLTRNIAALVREDGASDPAFSVDRRDSATPRAMGQLLAGIYQGKWHSDSSRRVLLDAMAATTTGKKRMPAALPMSANLVHKTGTLSRTASDIGIFHTPDGRAVAVAIYVTGQSSSMAAENGDRGVKLEARRLRDERIASITDALYQGYAGRGNDGRNWANAQYGAGTK